MRFLLLTMWALFAATSANYPVFEGANQLRELLIPADVRIGSVIYRLRASDSDHDYPLQFDATDYGSYVVRVENLPCGVNSTHCEANVYLDRVLMNGQVFKFRFTVRDTKGDTTTAPASIEVTDAPVDITTIFPHLPGIIILPESTKVGTELEYVIVRTHPEHKKPVFLEIRGSPVVDFSKVRNSQETTTGVIALKQSLDFEQQNMYKLQIFALDMFTDKLVDSRNIAGFEIILIVEDVQDTPPIFTCIEPTVKLSSNLTQGDVITKVTAIDGDKGNPRQIRYGLISENNPFTIFFNIDRITGQITLAKPLKQLMAIVHSHQPILMTIMAEEEKSKPTDISMSTTTTIALLPAEAGNTAPYFDNDHYVCHLNENSPQGTALVFSDAYSTQVHDNDMGKHGVFSLILDQNNGTFEISPNVVEQKAFFTIRVRNKLLLDYEIRKSVHFVIVARELDPGSLSSSATVLVYLSDVNDNHPQFQKSIYMASIPENATANTFITKVEAVDIDTGVAGIVHYPRIHGLRNSSLLLNSVTGVISMASDNHGFDREEASEYHMTVEARDMEGTGLLSTVPLIIRILDVNDETPYFDNNQYHFTLSSDLKNFSTQAFIKAIDKDAEPPNNVVRYEIINGNYDNKFSLNAETGELTVRYHTELKRESRVRRQVALNPANNNFILTVRAYDLGVPHRWTIAQVRIFPPETGSRLMHFIIPAKGLDYQSVEELLTKMTGGRVTIVDIKPSKNHRNTRAVPEDSERQASSEKSTVTARVTYGDDSVIDAEQVFRLLQPVFYKSPQNSEEESAPVHTAEYGSKFYWILLIILLLVIVILITLLLCYLWKCFPSILAFNKSKKGNRVSAESRSTVNLQNKGVQVANNNHLERNGSGDSIRHSRNWKFYGHREPEPQTQPVLLISKNISPIHYRRMNTTMNEEGPAFIYHTSDLAAADKQGDLFIQDIADTEYSILDPAKLHMRTYNKPYGVADAKYDRRRGSPSSEVRNITPRNHRAETYLKEGNAEILRLRTEGKQSADYAEQPDLSEPSFGRLSEALQKEAVKIQQRRAVERRKSSSGAQSINSIDKENLRADNKVTNISLKDSDDEYTPVQNGPSNIDVQKIDEIEGEQRSRVRRDTRGVEDEKISNQDYTEKTSQGLDPEYLSKSANLSESINEILSRQVDNPNSENNLSDDNQTQKSHSPLIRRQSTHSSQKISSQLTSKSSSLDIPNVNLPSGALTTDQIIQDILDDSQFAKDQSEKSGIVDTTAQESTFSIQNEPKSSKEELTRSDALDELQVVPLDQSGTKDSEQENSRIESELTKSAEIADDTPPVEVKDTLEREPDPDLEEQQEPIEVTKSSSLIGFLTDSQKLQTTDQGGDTLSLPGSLSMATQTDRHCATQTEMLCLLRSKPRRVKSENNSSDSEPDNGKIRRYKVAHKIRTPIIEERQTVTEMLSSGKPKLRRQSRKEARDESEVEEKKSIGGSSTNNGEGEHNDPVESLQEGGTNTAGLTLKLRGKNQQLMEKKSVFTIAYDDATTEHLGVSSNGSIHDVCAVYLLYLFAAFVASVDGALEI